MQKFDVEIKKASYTPPLPAGGYVAEIKDANVIEYSWGEVLAISFDIAEGEHKDHFAADYRNNAFDNKKWKGVYRITVPNEDDQWYDSQERIFGNALACIQCSNPGFEWKWDEKGLKGLKIGVVFRDKEWSYNGQTGWTTECGALADVADIVNNTFKKLPAKPLKDKPAETQTEPVSIDSAVDDLPF